MPLAQVGYSYNIPTAYAVDEMCGECSVEANVWFNYGSSQATQISSNGNSFKTDRVGWYTIEYVAKDNFGNESKELLYIYCGYSIPELTVGVDSPLTDIYMGEVFTPKAPVVTNSSGEYEVNIVAIDPDGVEIDIKDNVIPEVKGQWTIKYICKDMIGREATYSHSLNVTISDKPILRDTISVPKAYIGGGTYELEKIYAYQYNENGYDYVEPEIIIDDGTEPYDCGGEYVANPSLDNGIKIKTSYKYNGHTLYETDVPYVKAHEYNAEAEYVDLLLENYFIGDDFEIHQQPKGTYLGVDATANKNGDVSFMFANPVLADKFYLNLKSFVGDAKYDALEVKLTDSVNYKQSFTSRFEFNGTGTKFAVSGKTVPSSFNKNNDSEFIISYANGIMTLEDEISYNLAVSKFDDGSEFTDFDSHKVYVEVKLINALVGAKVNIIKINNHLMLDYGDGLDQVKPEVIKVGPSGGSFGKDSVIETNVIYAQDVIAPNVLSSVTVQDPSRKSIIKEEDPQYSYNVTLSEFGVYTIKYEVLEYFENQYFEGNVKEETIKVYSMDVNPPTITLNSEMVTTANLNDVVSIASFTAVDDKSSEENIIKVRYIIAPNGLIKIVDDNYSKLKVTMLGIYEIRYTAQDEEGNISSYSHYINVR